MDVADDRHQDDGMDADRIGKAAPDHRRIAPPTMARHRIPRMIATAALKAGALPSSIWRMISELTFQLEKISFSVEAN